jgi:hypothetical protein
LELYFYDDDPNLEHRFHHSPNLDRDVIRRVVDILKDNPYSQMFRNLGGVDDLEEYRIELNTDMRLDQRRYNLPISSEVAAVWVESNDLRKHFECSVILFCKDNDIESIHIMDVTIYCPIHCSSQEERWVGILRFLRLVSAWMRYFNHVEFVDKIKVIPLKWLKMYSSLFSSHCLLLCCSFKSYFKE